MSEVSTISELITRGRDDDIAIAAPGRPSLTFHQLREQINTTVTELNSLGIGRKQRVAIVLPNGPEMAAAFVSIACGATTAPLNPAYRQEEFEFYLSDLNTKALVVDKGSASPALEAAAKLGIPVLELEANDDDPAGCFKFSITNRRNALGATATGGMARHADTALVLHTSGTTSRPKIVPLTHGNICASARYIRETLALTADDRCMNIMPLFHIHGLVAAILSSLGAGASVFCTPGFTALKYFQWLNEANPTWYTAVPTMHQAILARAERNSEVIASTPLRFIRSSSSSLPPQVMHELEATFGVAVIEAYAMTEAAHQMTSNPLPPRPRKPGSVGIAAGPEVAIMDKDGALLESGETGEVVIKGSNVTLGYENNAKANAENFTKGWFRTGDQGVMDADGYLKITGRLKEIINRGGEKVSPCEVDDVLMNHPAVRQVVTFALPHPKLGEDVAAAIVVHENATATDSEIREFAASHLADFKVPRKIIFLEEIPRGPTGKLQRIGLAEKLGMA